MTVSLCIIAYNEQSSLPKLLGDIALQTYPKDKTELVFVNSASTDNTAEVFSEFAAQHENEYMSVQLLDNPARSQASGWNKAISAAVGDVIIRIDAHASVPADFTENNMKLIASGEYVCGGARPSRIEQPTPYREMLLTAESTLQRVIDSDENLKASYSKIRTLRLKASDPKASPSVAQQATLEADRLERLLGSSANTLYQFMDFLKVSAADVKAKLNHNDVAVEFVDYRVGKDSTMYAALIMSPQWEHVLFLPLIEQRELSSSSDNLTSRIWTPILDTVGSNVENIFFSPTGLLYQLPIESHPLPDGRSLGEAYRLHRMSSTRWLVVGQDSTVGNNALVYGGLTYDATIEEMKEEAERSSQSRIKGKQRNGSRGAGDLIGLDYLPATKMEAEIITQTINEARKKNLHADILLGSSGTETSFKQLSGQKKQLVHIATHGFFNDKRTAETDILSQCGLYFAGADNKIQGELIPEGIDDGVLTAEEISSLDLRGLDLITLSACQTGQGNITSDGVFGLQRSFKKAGANSIMMSLWKVDDEATCLLMTEFYKNWISFGKSKIDALEIAKRSVRFHKEKGWDDPKYWAAFILLDAL